MIGRLAIAACAGLVAGCGGGGDAPPVAPSTTTTAPAAPRADATPVDASSAPESATSLLARANAAFAANRLVAPAGDNALELLLAVRRADPGNVPAQEALIELFPFAVTASRRALADGDLVEAARLIELFAQANPDSLAVRELRATLAARQARATPPAAATASPRLAPTTPATTPLATTGTSPAAPLATGTTPAADARPAPAAPGATAPGPRDASPAPAAGAPAAQSPAAAAVNETAAAPPPRADVATDRAVASAVPARATASTTARDAPASTAPAPARASTYVEATVVSRAAPEYPAVARQRRIAGWVDVEFTVRADGSVGDVRIVGAEPSRVFDQAAQRAVMRWKFKPAMRDGRPEASRTRTRLTFRPS